MLSNINPGIVIVGFISLFILILWEKPFFKKNSILKLIPGALVVVVLSVLINILFMNAFPGLVIQQEHLVNLPLFDSLSDVGDMLPNPYFSMLQSLNV